MLDPAIKELASVGSNFGTVSLQLPSGAIASHVMWVDADDDHIMFNTEIHRAKFRALGPGSPVTMTVWKGDNPYAYAEVRGHVAETVGGDEARARAERLGIWADPYYSVLAADRPAELIGRAGRYELVEGRVLLADHSGSRVYLNFGRFWKEDFTVVIEAPALRLFNQDGLDPLTLDGALVRVRGWVDDRDGPRIEVTHPEQIEVLARQ